MKREQELSERIERLEGAVRRAHVVALLALVALGVTWLTGMRPGPQAAPEELRARTLVIEDADGRDRIVLGAPMPDGRQVTGMKILNPEGAEQFGLSIKHDGGVSMGLDARPGMGNPANRERLNLGVTATGQGWIRFLDNETRVRMWVRLDASDAPAVELWDWGEDTIRVRRVGFAGDQRKAMPR